MTNYRVNKGILRLVSRVGEQSQIVELNSSMEVAIGRDPSCQIKLDSANYSGISRRHAAIRPLAFPRPLPKRYHRATTPCRAPAGFS
jgi:hypothetical protein